jgi:hypothetical protein
MTEDRVENEFYGQLWSCSEGISQNQYTKPQTLVWIRRDLFEQRRFSEQDFFPRSEGDRADELKVLSLEKCAVAGWKKVIPSQATEFEFKFCFTFIFISFRESLSCGVQVAGAAWRAATRIVAGVGDLVQRIGDGCTGWVLDDRAIERSVGVVCSLHRARGDEEREFLG